MTTLAPAQLRARAEAARDAFELATRAGEPGPGSHWLIEDGKARYWRVKPDEKPQWITDLCREAHCMLGDSSPMMPDDWRYAFIVDALDILSETSDEDEISERLDSDVDVYTVDLLQWLASHLSRTSYVDEARENFGVADMDKQIAQGQYMERREVLDQVRESLASLTECVCLKPQSLSDSPAECMNCGGSREAA